MLERMTASPTSSPLSPPRKRPDVYRVSVEPAGIQTDPQLFVVAMDTLQELHEALHIRGGYVWTAARLFERVHASSYSVLAWFGLDEHGIQHMAYIDRVTSPQRWVPSEPQ